MHLLGRFWELAHLLLQLAADGTMVAMNASLKEITLIGGSRHRLKLLQEYFSRCTVHYLPPSSHEIQDRLTGISPVVVLDLTAFSGAVGPSVRQLIGWISPNVQVVVLCEDERQSAKAARKGISSTLVRPVSKRELISSVVGALDRDRLLKELKNTEEKNTQLRKQNRSLKKDIKDLLAIGESARSITSTLLIEEILRGILTGIRDTLGLDKVLLGLVNSEKQIEEVKVAIGVRDVRLDLGQASWSITSSDPVWARLQADSRPHLVDVESNSLLPDFIRSIFKKTFVKVPMVVKDQLIGTVMGERPSRPITSRDLRLLQIFAEYAGIAIENGRLYYEVIKSEEELMATQNQLLEAERMAVVGQMAISVRHEINNPLCNISLITQLASAELGQTEPRLATLLGDIESNVHRIRDVTERLSGLKKASVTEYLPSKYMIDLNPSH